MMNDEYGIHSSFIILHSSFSSDRRPDRQSKPYRHRRDQQNPADQFQPARFHFRYPCGCLDNQFHAERMIVLGSLCLASQPSSFFAREGSAYSAMASPARRGPRVTAAFLPVTCSAAAM